MDTRRSGAGEPRRSIAGIAVDIVVVSALTAHGAAVKAVGFTDSDRLDGARMEPATSC
jgi:hypothetical protein